MSSKIINLKQLQKMAAFEFEELRGIDYDTRCELTSAVVKEIVVPERWSAIYEYITGFGDFFPVQVNFTPWHRKFHLTLCSPGELSSVWQLIMLYPARQIASIVQKQRILTPKAISHSLALVATLDIQGHNIRDIIRILMMEGGK
ncbi:TPA: conjugation system SOS inhibitor PsiB [Escherichia coli]|nr:conjugation system SOS inhibitor PsiB [Escherichia marmotae]MEC9656830.1 conjugation system SOS inhibitor PsiB [Escherichia coli]MED8847200.1 conjugation system SOS inhibitor PsiB [Escherichia coli]MED9369235.1 conjugation system SOS inhibitor PsiB [Escherichia coli]MED9634509.1 conjugation system SOS inhibitor PsiB [Escherichia marmotae]